MVGGGIETVTSHLLNSHFSIENDVILLTESMLYDEWLSDFPKRVKQYRWTGSRRIDRIRNLYKIYRENPDIDLVIDTGNGHQLMYNYIARKMARRNCKIVSWYHVSMNSGIVSHSKYFNKFADAYLAISSGIKRQLIDIGINQKNIYMVYNMIPRREVYSLPNDSYVHFVYIGRINEMQKNISELIRGFSKIDHAKYCLDIYGVNENKAEQQKEFELAERLGINVNWHGWKKYPWKLAEQEGINYLIMTSNFEGFPMVLLEAISRGIPVISSNCISGPEDIITDDNGYMYQLHNLDQLHQTINEAINRHNDWNQEKIQESITDCYEANYITHLQTALKQILNEP